MKVGCPTGCFGEAVNLAIPADLSICSVSTAYAKIKTAGLIPVALVVHPDKEAMAREVMEKAECSDGMLLITDSEGISGGGWLMVGE